MSRPPRAVYVQFSNHTQLKTDQTHSNASPSAQAALQAAQALVGTGGDTGKETVRFCTTLCPFAALRAVQALVGTGGDTGKGTVRFCTTLLPFFPLFRQPRRSWALVATPARRR